MEGLNKKIKGLGGGHNSGGADQDQVNRLAEELNKLRAEFEAHRDLANRNLNELNQTMPTKADKQDRADLENRIMDQLRDMIQQILG